MNQNDKTIKLILGVLYEQLSNHRKPDMTFEDFFKKLEGKGLKKDDYFKVVIPLTTINPHEGDRLIWGSGDLRNPKNRNTIRLSDYGQRRLSELEEQPLKEIQIRINKEQNETNKEIKNIQWINIFVIILLVVATIFFGYKTWQIGEDQTEISSKLASLTEQSSIPNEAEIYFKEYRPDKNKPISKHIAAITNPSREPKSGFYLQIYLANIGRIPTGDINVVTNDTQFSLIGNTRYPSLKSGEVNDTIGLTVRTGNSKKPIAPGKYNIGLEITCTFCNETKEHTVPICLYNDTENIC